MNDKNRVHSIAKWAQQSRKRTGFVTNTRVTDASPAGVYAHVANRDWESDYDVRRLAQNPAHCKDLAQQLVCDETGRNLNVILGGGRSKFLPYNIIDDKENRGERLDKLNLIAEWLKQKKGKKLYVSNREQLLKADNNLKYLLGLFTPSHFNYHLERNLTNEPTLAEMTESAIKVLSKGKNGFFLFVEGGRIDYGHHYNLAQIALDETVQFSEAVQKALDLTSRDDTLIVVTSDHSHTMSFSGYAERGNDILGVAGIGDDKIPYSTLSYANGPGYDHEGYRRKAPNIADMRGRYCFGYQ